MIRKDRLHIVGGAHVRKIILKENKDGTKRADGVIYVKNGEEVKVHAKKEIILSGGSIGTAQLLMLSGIGPKEHLKEVGVRRKQEVLKTTLINVLQNPRSNSTTENLLNGIEKLSIICCEKKIKAWIKYNGRDYLSASK